MQIHFDESAFKINFKINFNEFGPTMAKTKFVNITKKTEDEIKKYHKDTIDHFVEDLRKTCHAMIEGKHVCESPIALVREAIDYLDDFYKDAKSIDGTFFQKDRMCFGEYLNKKFKDKYFFIKAKKIINNVIHTIHRVKYMLEVNILGCGSSLGVPVIGCSCLVCKSDSPYNKRLRSSIIISQNETRVLVDFGFNIREQLINSEKNKNSNI